MFYFLATLEHKYVEIILFLLNFIYNLYYFLKFSNRNSEMCTTRDLDEGFKELLAH